MTGNRWHHRFLRWYRGLPPEEPQTADAAPLDAATPTVRYHNRSIGERFLAWREASGPAAYRYLYNTVAVITCLTIIGALLLTTVQLPPFGDPGNPTNNEVTEKYLTDPIDDTGALNAVAAVILDYRAFDTFGESCVLFTAVCAVLLLLRNEGRRDLFDELLHEMEEPRHDGILEQSARVLVPAIMMFGFYVVLGGHLGPGGGFSGGAIIGASLILYASAFGTKAARRFMDYRRARRVISASLLFYALGKSYAFYTGANHLDTGIPLGTPGALLSGGLILPLNIAVALIVACVMYMLYILFSKGEML